VPEAAPGANGAEDVVVTAKGKPRRLTDANIQKELGQVERQIAKLEGRLNEISDALAVASIDEDMPAVTRLGEEYEKVQADLDESYARWETISSAAGVAV
jgi:DNA repair exonuclease SbcCD ATPase subunit